MKKLFLVILIAACFLITPRSAGSASSPAETNTASTTLYLPFAMNSARVGDQISLHITPQDFPQNTPFHVAHGWWLEPGNEHNDDFGFDLQVDGVWQDLDTMESKMTPEGWLSHSFIYNFPAGMSGTHTFTGYWYGRCADLFDDCSNPDEIVLSGVKEAVVNFVP